MPIIWCHRIVHGTDSRMAVRHTGSVLKKRPCPLNAMWGVLFTLILILYMGLRPVSVYFGDTVNYAKGFYTAANSRDPFSWQWEGEWLFYKSLRNGLPDVERHPYFFLLCATVYIGSLWLAQTYLRGILSLSHTRHVYFLSYRVNGIGMAWEPPCSSWQWRMSTVHPWRRVMRVGSRDPQIHLSDGWSKGHTDWFIKNSYWYLAGWMACRRIAHHRRTYPGIFGGKQSDGETTAFPAIWQGDDNMVGEIVQMSMTCWDFLLYECHGQSSGQGYYFIFAASSRTSITIDRQYVPVTNAFWSAGDPCRLFQPFRPDFVVHHAGGIDLSVHEGTFWVNHEKNVGLCVVNVLLRLRFILIFEIN